MQSRPHSSASARAARCWRWRRRTWCGGCWPRRMAWPKTDIEIRVITTTRRPADRPPAERGRRQGPVLQGDRGGAAGRRNRPRRPFLQGPGDGAARRARCSPPSSSARISATPSSRCTAPSLDDLPQGAKLGTSSIRRAAQMLRAPARSRDRALPRQCRHAAGQARATASPTRRCSPSPASTGWGEADRITSYLDPRRFPPAPAQGAIGIEIRADDARTAGIVAPLDHAADRDRRHRRAGAARDARRLLPHPDRRVYRIERKLRARCTAEILSPDGRRVFDATLSGKPARRRRDRGANWAGVCSAWPGPNSSNAFRRMIHCGPHARDTART